MFLKYINQSNLILIIIYSIHNNSESKNESMNYNKIISSKMFLGINGKSPGPQIEVKI